jgi:hypothetical protein
VQRCRRTHRLPRDTLAALSARTPLANQFIEALNDWAQQHDDRLSVLSLDSCLGVDELWTSISSGLEHALLAVPRLLNSPVSRWLYLSECQEWEHLMITRKAAFSHLSSLSMAQRFQLLASWRVLRKRAVELRRQAFQTRELWLVDQLNISWRARDLASTWKWIRLIAGAHRGPKRRCYCVLSSGSPSAFE